MGRLEHCKIRHISVWGFTGGRWDVAIYDVLTLVRIFGDLKIGLGGPWGSLAGLGVRLGGPTGVFGRHFGWSWETSGWLLGVLGGSLESQGVFGRHFRYPGGVLGSPWAWETGRQGALGAILA